MTDDLTKEEVLKKWEEIFKWAEPIYNVQMVLRNFGPNELWEVDPKLSHGEYLVSSTTKFNTWQLAEFVEWVKNNV